MTTLRIVRDTLTDGSEVFDLRIIAGENEFVDIPCPTEASANTLLDAVLHVLKAAGIEADVADEAVKYGGWSMTA